MNRCVLSLLLCWTVMATPLRVMDGDTFDARLDIWLGLTAIERVRVLGVNTPEMRGEGKTSEETAAIRAAAQRAKQFTEAWLTKGDVQIDACKRDAFGRVLGTVRRDGESLTTALIAAGLGIPR